jgi:putative cell wall-binding protein
MPKLKYIMLVFMLSHLSITAQVAKKNLNYAKQPYWIEMMRDPNTNYFETIKAYTVFWEKRKKPKEEDDIIGQSKTIEAKKNFLQRWFKSKEEREEEEIKKYALDVKKFRHWKIITEPYVQEDGKILSADERLKIWQDQQK